MFGCGLDKEKESKRQAWQKGAQNGDKIEDMKEREGKQIKQRRGRKMVRR